MTFAWVWSFLLFVPLAAAAWRMLRKAKRSGIKFSTVSRLPVRTAGWRAKMADLAPWLFLIACTLLVIAAARPRKELARGKSQVDAIAIAMTIDVSGSMEAIDLTPKGTKEYKTRLDVVKEMFERFVDARPDDLIGLVSFGGYASSLSPLTADHEALIHVLKGVKVPDIYYENNNPINPDEQMTAVGDGLATALARLKDINVKSKIVILLSDGVSNSGVVEPKQAAEAAKKMGIKVYTIGVGTHSKKTPIISRDLFGRKIIAYTDMSFDETQLKEIAAATQGRYFGVRDAKGLEEALEEIDSLEKTTLDQTVYRRYTEYFSTFLLWGVALLFLAVTLQMMASRRVV